MKEFLQNHEWDFSGLPDHQIKAACFYEYALESQWLRKKIQDFQKQNSDEWRQDVQNLFSGQKELRLNPLPDLLQVLPYPKRWLTMSKELRCAASTLPCFKILSGLNLGSVYSLRLENGRYEQRVIQHQGARCFETVVFQISRHFGKERLREDFIRYLGKHPIDGLQVIPESQKPKH